MTLEKSPRKNRTSGLERAFQVLDSLVEIGEPATAYQIAKRIKAPISTIYEIISVLEKLNILTQTGGEGKYFLGIRMQFYGLAYSRSMGTDDVYRREAEALSKSTGQNVHICVRDDDHLVVAMVVDGSDQFHISSRPGSRTPLNWNASGRLLIGHLTPRERAEVFSRATPSPTGQALTDPQALEEACLEAFAQGYCIQIAESEFAVACIAAPVINGSGECVATISLVLPERTALAKGKELAREVMASARNIERHLGWKEAVTMQSFY